MKKTTTRLATIAAVLVMSAFAIVLAQHDARKRDQIDDPLQLAGARGPTEAPLDGESVWPGKNPIVRANNEKLQPASWDREAYSVEQPALPQLPDPDSHAPDDPHPLVQSIPWHDSDHGAQAYSDPPSLSSSGNSMASLEDSLGAGFSSSDSTSDSLEDGMSREAFAIRQAQTQAQTQAQVITASGQQATTPGWMVDNGSLPTIPDSPAASAPIATLDSPQPVGFPAEKNSTDLQYPPANNGPSSAPGLPPAESPPFPTAGPAFPTTGSGLLPVPTGNSGDQRSNSQSNSSATANGSAFPAASFPKQSDQSSSGGFGRAFEQGGRTALVSNQPGSRFLDGSQNPIMQILKRAPEEIQVGKKATFVITVRNAGNATAHDVTVVDRVPQGARFEEASPATTPTPDGVLSWALGEMAAGDERTISLQIIPEVEGEVGSVASVHFVAQASVRTVATLPQLVLEADSTGPVIIGQSQQIVVTLQNTGSGVARSVRLEADIPNQLRHESGETQLEAYVGDLRPGESRRLTLVVAAVQPGQSQCVLRTVNDDGIQAERAIDIDVRTPQLAATISGPSLRYLERQATYQIKVTNTGTALARNLDFVVHLPVGLKFISVDIPQATYNPQAHSVTLGLAELDSGQSAPFTIAVLPIQLGPQVVRFNATGDLGITADAKAQVTVAGLAELAFTIGQDNGTVEVGATTTYAVQVTNVGNQPDKNVQLVVQLPEGTKLLQVDAPVEYRVEAGRIVFAPVSEMRNRDTKTFRFQIQHNRAGNQVVRSQLTSENWPVAVVKEEGTLVYNDQN